MARRTERSRGERTQRSSTRVGQTSRQTKFSDRWLRAEVEETLVVSQPAGEFRYTAVLARDYDERGECRTALLTLDWRDRKENQGQSTSVIVPTDAVSLRALIRLLSRVMAPPRVAS